MKTAMKINGARLPKAEAAVKQGNWLEFVTFGVPTLYIDYRLLPVIGQYLEEGELGVGTELAGHYLIALARHGEADENPAYLELNLTWKKASPVTVYLCTINGSVYFSAEPMMPF